MQTLPHTNSELSGTDLLEAFKLNDDQLLQRLYRVNYAKVESLVLKNSGTKDHAKDVYQEAFLTVWLNIKQNKFQPNSDTAIHGYLYTIAKNKWMDYLRSKDYKLTVVSSNIEYKQVNDERESSVNDDTINDARLQSVMHCFKNLDLPCKELLTKFYFEKKSMKDIAKELQLDAASTRNKKYRCMQKLRELALIIEK